MWMTKNILTFADKIILCENGCFSTQTNGQLGNFNDCGFFSFTWVSVVLFWWASPSETGLPGHILVSKLLVLSKCFCLWLPFTNRKKSLQTNTGTQSDMCYYIAPLVHITRGPAQLPGKNRCPRIRVMLTGCSSPSEGNARKPLLPPTLPRGHRSPWRSCLGWRWQGCARCPGASPGRGS